MAKGSTHHKANMVVSVSTALPIAIFGNFDLLQAHIVGCSLGILFGPDMDIKGVSHQESFVGYWIGTLIHEKVGDFATLLLQILTFPYAYFIPHRSWLSHAPIISTILRSLYVLTYVLFIWVLTGVGLYLLTSDNETIRQYVISFPFFIHSVEHLVLCVYAFLVFCVLDIIHFVFDGCMLRFRGKNRYLLGKPFYKLMRGILKIV